jgi:hypothetical protein
LILNSKGLDERVSGEAAEPADKTSPEWKKWNAINSLIVAWLLNSLVPNIAASVEALTKAFRGMGHPIKSLFWKGEDYADC